MKKGTSNKRDVALRVLDDYLSYMGMPIEKAQSDLKVVTILGLEKFFVSYLNKHSKKLTKNAYAMLYSELFQNNTTVAKEGFVRATSAIEAYLQGEKLTPAEIQAIANVVNTAYDIGKTEVAKPVGLVPKTNMVDLKAVNWCAKDANFWIGDNFNTRLSESIQKTVIDNGMFLGLGRKEVGAILKDNLNAYYKKTDAYWRGLAATVINRARCFGGVSAMEQAMVEEYEILAMMDERTSPFCRMMDGHIFRLGDAIKARDDMLNATDPEEVKKVHPWIPYKKAVNMTHKELVGQGQALPPYHFYCRTTYIVRSFAVPDAIKEAPPIINCQAATPSDVLSQNINDYKYDGDASSLGGAGAKSFYLDAAGNRYIYKPGQTKSGTPEPFRAHIQKSASDLGDILYGKGEHVEVTTITVNGQLGTMQKIVPDVTKNLGGVPLSSLTREQLRMIQQEHVLDYVMGNYDAHGKNFVMDKNGKIWGVDKEQAFRYFADTKSHKMDLTYHPNIVHGEKPPIYNLLFKGFADGDIDLDLQDTLPILQRLEKISDAEYKNILKNYTKTRFNTADEMKEFLDWAVDRKNGLRAEYEAFYTGLLKMRIKGFKGKFQFSDSMPLKNIPAAPLAAQPSAALCQAMSMKELKEMAKNMGINGAPYLTKDELIDVITGKTPKGDTMAIIKARRAQKRAARAAGKVKPAPVVIEADTEDFMDIMNGLTHDRDGTYIPLDGDIVEGQYATGRILTRGGVDHVVVDMKIRQPYHKTIDKMMDNIDASVSKKSSIITRTFGDSRMVEVDGVKITWTNRRNPYAAMQGALEFEVKGATNTQAAEKIKKVLEKYQKEAIIASRTAEDINRHKAMRVLWQVAPKEADALAAMSPPPTYAEVLQRLKMAGYEPDVLNKLKLKKVANGHYAYVWEGRAAHYKALGADHVFVGAGKNNLGFLIEFAEKKESLKCTSIRTKLGIGGGASVVEDMKSGGADSVFARLATKNAVGNAIYSDSFLATKYRIIYDIRVLERTDWYAYTSDTFGSTSPGFMNARLSPDKFIEKMNTSYRPSNEIMFRNALPHEDAIGIVCQNSTFREDLLDILKAKGVSKINGVPIGKFVTVSAKIKEFSK
jgi:uncharacterized alkaline shock family protein YloU